MLVVGKGLNGRMTTGLRVKASRLRTFKFPELILWLGVLFFILHCFDAWITAEGVAMGGREINPLLAWMGLQWMMIVKMLVALGITIWVIRKGKRGLAVYGCFMTGGVVFWNLFRISQLMQ